MRRETFIRTLPLASALLLLVVRAGSRRMARAARRPRGFDRGPRHRPARRGRARRDRHALRARAHAARLSTATDDDGAYRFERLAPGEYLVEAGAAGFAPGGARAVTVARGAAGALDFAARSRGRLDRGRRHRCRHAADRGRGLEGRHVVPAARDGRARRVDRRGGSAHRAGPARATARRPRLARYRSRRAGFGARTRPSSSTACASATPSAAQGDATSFLADFAVTDAARRSPARLRLLALRDERRGRRRQRCHRRGRRPVPRPALRRRRGPGFARGRAQFSGSAGEAERLVFSAGVSHLNVIARRGRQRRRAHDQRAGPRALASDADRDALGARLRLRRFRRSSTKTRRPSAPSPRPASSSRPLSRDELRRYESGMALGQLNLGGATFMPAANDPDISRAGRFFSGALAFTHRPPSPSATRSLTTALVTRNSFREGPAVPATPPTSSSSRRARPPRLRRLGPHAQRARRLPPRPLTTSSTPATSSSARASSTQLPRRDAFRQLSADVAERSHAFFMQDQLRFLDDRLQLSAAFRAQTFTLGAPRFTPDVGRAVRGAHVRLAARRLHGRRLDRLLLPLDGHEAARPRRQLLPQAFALRALRHFLQPLLRLHALSATRASRPSAPSRFDAGVDQSLCLEPRAALGDLLLHAACKRSSASAPSARTTRSAASSTASSTRAAGSRAALELSAEVAPARTFNLFASYTYTNSDQRRPAVPGVLRTFAIPDHQFTLVATQRFGARVAVNFDFVATSDYLAPVFDNRTFVSRAYRFGGQRRADLTRATRSRSASREACASSASVENLFDRDYYENGFRTPGLSGRAGAALNFYKPGEHGFDETTVTGARRSGRRC